MFAIGLLRPGEKAVPILNGAGQPGIGDGRQEFLVRQVFRPVEQLARVLGIAHPRGQGCQHRRRQLRRGARLAQFLNHLPRFLLLSGQPQNVRQGSPRLGVIGVQVHGLLGERKGAVRLIQRDILGGRVGGNGGRKRIERQRAPGFGNGFVPAPLSLEPAGPPGEREGRSRTRFEGAIKLRFGAGPVPVVLQLDDAQSEVSVARIGVERHGPFGGIARGRHGSIGPRHGGRHTILPDDGQPGPRQGEIRVDAGGFFQAFCGAVQGFGIGLIEEIAAPQIGGVGLPGWLMAMGRRCGQAHLKPAGDGCGEGMLGRRQILRRPVERGRPEMVSVGRARQLQGDVQAPAGLANAAFEDCGDAQLPAGVALHLEGRSPRYHVQSGCLTQSVDNLSGEARGKPLVVFPRSQVGERQDHQGADRGAGHSRMPPRAGPDQEHRANQARGSPHPQAAGVARRVGHGRFRVHGGSGPSHASGNSILRGESRE